MQNSPFQLFWENSKINAYNAISFFKNIEKDNKKSHVTSNLYYSAKDILLPTWWESNQDLLQTIASRRTRYNLSPHPIKTQDLSAICSALWWINSKRNIPSAGAKYPIELYMILFASELFKKPALVYYNTDNHSLSFIKDVPNWEDLRWILWWNLEQLDGSPSFCVFIVWEPSRTMEKYGERGGRFVLLEAWALMQNISIIGHSLNIGTIITWWYFDNEIAELLDIDKNQCMICSSIIWWYISSHETH